MVTHATRLRTSASVLYLLAGAACAGSFAERPFPARGAADEARVRRCPASVPPAGDPLDRAAACAEAFVARNGYTTAVSVPPDELALEPGEVGHTPAEVLAARRGSLAPRARVVCALRGDTSVGYKVAFTLLNMPTRRRIVTVEMNAEHSHLTVIHPTELPSGSEAALPAACRTGGMVTSGATG